MKAIVFFDIDGTLLRSGGAGKLAMERAVCETFGVAPAGVRIPFSGRTDRAIIRDLLQVHGVAATEENFQRFVPTYLRLLPEFLRRTQGCVLPGVLELLNELHNRDDTVVGLLTGNLRLGARTKLGHFGLAERFVFGGFGDQHYERDAVAREALAKAHDYLNGQYDPRRLWVVGDTPLDIQCARSIGARVLAVATGTHSLEELQAHQPDLAFPNLTHYRAFLECF